MNRLRAWWAGRSRAERALVGLGVPVVALAALWSNLRARGAAAASQATEGGPGASPAVPLTAPGVLNVGAPGIGADQLGAFADAFTGEVSAIEDRLEAIESPGFAESPAIAAAAKTAAEAAVAKAAAEAAAKAAAEEAARLDALRRLGRRAGGQGDF